MLNTIAMNVIFQRPHKFHTEIERNWISIKKSLLLFKLHRVAISFILVKTTTHKIYTNFLQFACFS